ncbi:hypothetical protein [Mycoplasmopsis agassizii]|uniref:DUF16 domain-containing protein n=1 Tax=Mycoplasmopsis agassizii TaxID=33922 RepID=A0ABX4H4I6_9BACT|nr:hypothetical protein [Mycoplasmopsis agassizii]PAF54801.1 hypothetical protein CJF60_03635 [Mycoplasmopsis agassizii]SMC19279.1 hypothetical protein SAMN02745179_00869 [Mycoplasmopsis agassizii]
MQYDKDFKTSKQACKKVEELFIEYQNIKINCFQKDEYLKFCTISSNEYKEGHIDRTGGKVKVEDLAKILIAFQAEQREFNKQVVGFIGEQKQFNEKVEAFMVAQQQTNAEQKKFNEKVEVFMENQKQFNNKVENFMDNQIKFNERIEKDVKRIDEDVKKIHNVLDKNNIK